MTAAAPDAVRVDRWLWAVRLCKTRSAATDACRGRHVWVNGAAAKPASMIRRGDRITAVLHGRERIVEVVELIDKRVGAPVAAGCLVDHTPPPPERPPPPIFVRDAAAGRPTKRERRQLDEFRHR